MGIFHSQDLTVPAEESEKKVECYSTTGGLVPYDFVYFVPFEADGYTYFDKYSVDMTFTIASKSSMVYYFGIYRQIDKISNITATKGIGELVVGSVYTSASKTLTFTLTNSPALASPIRLEQGSYWIAFCWKKNAGTVTAVANAGILTTGSVFSGWANQSHVLGRLGAAVNPFPTYMETGTGTSYQALAPTFQAGAGGSDSIWGGIFFSGDTYK